MAAQAHKDYSHVPLYRKLGIKGESSVLVMSPPDGFDLEVPPGVELLEGPADGMDVVLLFATRFEHLSSFEELAAALRPAGGLWVAWPKKSSKIATELDFDAVQRTGLQAGLVDNKSCAVDEHWQAVRFVFRVKDRPLPN
jgi:hypothetical protein